MDVTLNNDTEIDNSFAFRFGNNFIVNDGGRLLAAFGRNLPANSDDFDDLNTWEVFGDSSRGDSSSNRVNSRSRDRNSGSDSTSRSGNSFNNSLTLNFQDNTQLNQSQVETINAELSRQTGTEIREFTIERFIRNPNFVEGGDADQFITVEDTEYRVVPNGRASQSLNSALTSQVQNIIDSVTGREVNLSRTQTGSNENESSNRNIRSRNSNRRSNRNRESSNFQDYSGLRRRNPGLNYPDNQFFDFLQAQIVSNNTKVLAAPTLILSENPEEISGGANASGATQSSTGGFNLLGQQTIGRSRANESFVTVGTQVITALNVTTQENSTNVICEPEFATAGLAFGARVSKIDDNGFVTFSLTPTISAIVDFISGPTACSSDLAILSLRRLDTGSLRVRDGQTLILTGVISDEDQQEVSKWPILGDLPIVGQFFRRTSGSRRRNELVILVTPRIIDDEKGGTYGYGYTPGTQDARRLMYGVNN
ncbi:hypothetical protein H8F24_03315 [Synechococcus sp. CBW1002]|nr:hypothetical protein H8F24_03315 [Synechococcus sp. CBW1002]